jgi:ATP-dependent helicase/nuclease subunit A
VKKLSHLSVDPNQQQRAAASPAASVWVSASAGTGKTKVLTDRVLSLLLTGTEPQRILCLTFTRAAAAEMESRIADQLGKWTMAEEEKLSSELEELLGDSPDEKMIQRARQLFAHVLDAPGGMNILTIHAFCQSLLGRFPLEAEVPPHFALMDERDAEEMLIAAREELLNRARSGRDENLAAALAEVTGHIHETQFPDLLAELTYARGRLRRLIDNHGDIETVISNVHTLLSVGAEETPESVIAAASTNEAFDEFGLRLVITALAGGTKTDQERGLIIQNWLDDRERTAVGFDIYAGAFLTSSRYSSTIEIRKRLITKKASESTPGAQEILEEEAGRLARVLLHWRSVSVAKSTAGLLVLGEALLRTYQTHKQVKALLDYDDLILMAGDLLHREGVAPWVLFKLDGGIDHILIDEAQDTSPDQWRVIEALAGEFFAGEGTHDTPPTFFAVGDVKQSIYSFQGADPISFGAMRDYFAERVQAAGQDWRPIDLTVSFRSTQAVLSAVDAVFKLPDAADGVTLGDEIIHHEAWRAKEGGLVELWPPVEPREADAPVAWKPPVERIRGDAPQTRLAGLVAGRIAKMINDKEILESKGRPIEPGDVMVLVRRRSGFVEDLVRSLKELDIQVAGVDRMVLTEQMAVMDLIALGQFLLLPEDDLTLATVLKSPLMGLTEEHLFELAYNREGSLWQALGSNTSDPVFTSAHEELSSLLKRADFVPPFELYGEILGARHGRLKLVSRLGPDALDPISEFLNLALVYEKSHVASLEGFLYWARAGEVEIKRDLEQATQNAVRVMTVHGAKGLQAPIVFLPDTLQVPMQGASLFWPEDEKGQDQALLWPPRRGLFETVSEAERDAVNQRRDQEYRRLLYVAMTRAEDRLYVCGWHTKNKAPEQCWYNLVQAGLEGPATSIEDDYLKGAGETASSSVLQLITPQSAKIKEQQKSPEGTYSDLPDWASNPPEADPLPPSPLTPSRPDGEEPAVMSPLEGDDGARFKRGRIIHALLQTLPEMEMDQREEALHAYLARNAHDLSPDQQQEISNEILAVLSDSRFAPIFGPGSRAEVPLVGEIAGQIMSAQLDRLLVTEEEILVVDFKTNRPPPTDPNNVADIYLRQMAAYRLALTEIYPGREIHCALLWTVGPHLMALHKDQLISHEPKRE